MYCASTSSPGGTGIMSPDRSIISAGAPIVAMPGVGAGLFLLALRATPSERRALEARLSAAGIAVESRTDFTSYFRDPEGNRFAISHYPER